MRYYTHVCAICGHKWVPGPANLPCMPCARREAAAYEKHVRRQKEKNIWCPCGAMNEWVEGDEPAYCRACGWPI